MCLGWSRVLGVVSSVGDSPRFWGGVPGVGEGSQVLRGVPQESEGGDPRCLRGVPGAGAGSQMLRGCPRNLGVGVPPSPAPSARRRAPGSLGATTPAASGRTRGAPAPPAPAPPNAAGWSRSPAAGGGPAPSRLRGGAPRVLGRGLLGNPNIPPNPFLSNPGTPKLFISPKIRNSSEPPHRIPAAPPAPRSPPYLP